MILQIIAEAKKDNAATFLIEYFLLAVLLTLSTASLTHFLTKCMEKGMIFRKWHNLVRYYLWLRNAQWLAKILGLCIYCFGTWVYIITILLIGFFILPQFWIIFAVFAFFGIGLNYVWIELIYKIKE